MPEELKELRREIENMKTLVMGLFFLNDELLPASYRDDATNIVSHYIKNLDGEINQHFKPSPKQTNGSKKNVRRINRTKKRC